MISLIVHSGRDLLKVMIIWFFSSPHDLVYELGELPVLLVAGHVSWLARHVHLARRLQHHVASTTSGLLSLISGLTSGGPFLFFLPPFSHDLLSHASRPPTLISSISILVSGLHFRSMLSFYIISDFLPLYLTWFLLYPYIILILWLLSCWPPVFCSNK